LAVFKFQCEPEGYVGRLIGLEWADLGLYEGRATVIRDISSSVKLGRILTLVLMLVKNYSSAVVKEGFHIGANYYLFINDSSDIND
jgi:hypothetical protein